MRALGRNLCVREIEGKGIMKEGGCIKNKAIRE